MAESDTKLIPLRKGMYKDYEGKISKFFWNRMNRFNYGEYSR